MIFHNLSILELKKCQQSAGIFLINTFKILFWFLPLDQADAGALAD